MLDSEGRLLVCDHGNRRVYRVEKDGRKTTLADRYDGKRFNSPNDLVVHSNGDIYFTDPPYGLKQIAKRELDFCGVYRLGKDGNVTLLTKELFRPNGIALSPDETTLYVAQSHRPAPIYKKYALKPDGTTDEKGEILYNARSLVGLNSPGMPDGMCVDVKGNLWATGPGGVLIISPEGNLLGRILMGKATANLRLWWTRWIDVVYHFERSCLPDPNQNQRRGFLKYRDLACRNFAVKVNHYRRWNGWFVDPLRSTLPTREGFGRSCNSIGASK